MYSRKGVLITRVNGSEPETEGSVEYSRDTNSLGSRKGYGKC